MNGAGVMNTQPLQAAACHQSLPPHAPAQLAQKLGRRCRQAQAVAVLPHAAAAALQHAARQAGGQADKQTQETRVPALEVAWAMHEQEAQLHICRTHPQKSHALPAH